MDAEQVKDCTIFLTVTGSRAYGTNIPESDTDVRGVCIPTNWSYYTGTGMNTFYQKDSGWEDDRVVYDARKALKLIADGNPNMVDLLFTPERFHIKTSKWWNRMLENRTEFLSRKMRFTYGGYAFAQLKRIKRHRDYLLNPPKAKPERTNFDLPATEKLVTSENMGAFQWLLSDLLHSSIEHMKLSDEAKEEFNGINMIGVVQGGKLQGDETAQALKTITGAPDSWINMVMREKRYNSAMRDWDSYQNWKKNRNEKRQVLEAKHGYDTKHAMHLVRLMRMGMEILETGQVHVYRPDREELLAIRNGAWEYDKLVEYAAKCDQDLADLYKVSKLRKQPRRELIDDLCVNLVKDYVSEREREKKTY